jgi:hypothetical protein
MWKNQFGLASGLLAICLLSWIPFLGSPGNLAAINAEHSGYLSQEFNGTYHVNWWPNVKEWAFWLDSQEGQVRLLFYCGAENTTTSTQDNLGIMGQGVTLGINVNVQHYDHYCADPSEVLFKDGDWIHVRGTLIVPSQLSAKFIGDLYVMEILSN